MHSGAYATFMAYALPARPHAPSARGRRAEASRPHPRTLRHRHLGPGRGLDLEGREASNPLLVSLLALLAAEPHCLFGQRERAREEGGRRVERRRVRAGGAEVALQGDDLAEARQLRVEQVLLQLPAL